MPTPRENTSIVKAPVLFRLPHLHRAAAARATAASGPAFVDQSLETAAPAYVAPKPTATTTESAAAPKSAAAPAQPERLATVTDESFMSRWGFDIKRSVILLAAMGLLWGAWAMGQKSATAPDESNLAEITETEPGSDPDTVEFPDEPFVAHIVEPKLNSFSGSSSSFEPVIEPKATASDLVNASEMSSADTNPAKTGVESDFSKLSLDALEPPSNGEFYGDYDLGEAAQSSAQKPPMTTDAGTPNQLALNQPATSRASEIALPSATNFVPSATPEMPGFDPKNIGNPSNVTPADNRPIFSSTPNGIIDWSRYLPGAGGSGSVRAASATQAIGGAAGEAQSADTQAIYLDGNDPKSPGVGVAPYYR